jgi:arabinofuranosyltransferase
VQRFAITLLLFCFLVVVAYQQLDRPPLGIDDAHIFFVYAKNLNEGHGIVYNPGGERVEGFSSPLWFMIVTAVFALTSLPKVVLLMVSMLLGATAVTFLWQWLDQTPAIRRRGLLLLVWVFSSPAYVVWTSLTLMDVALWSCLLILTTVALFQVAHPSRLTLLLPLLLLARPEGLLWAVVFIAVAALLTAVQVNWRTAARRAAINLLAYLGTVSLLMGWRLVYFGYLLPNTYYAKVSPDQGYNLMTGLLYLLDFLQSHAYLLLLVVGPALAGLILNLPWLVKTLSQPPARITAVNSARLNYIAVSLIAVTGLLGPVWTGGDHFGLFRFYQPVWPLLILPAFALFDVLQTELPRPGPALQYGLAVLLLAALLLLPPARWTNPRYKQFLNREFAGAEIGQAVGAALNELFPEDQRPSVGVIASGGFALAYEGVVIDTMGLNNVQMAHAGGDRQGWKNHAAFNVEVFMAQRPSLLLPEIGHNSERLTGDYLALYDWHNFVLKGLLQDEQFTGGYQMAIITRENRRVIAYVDRDYLAGLPEQGYQVERINSPLR